MKEPLDISSINSIVHKIAEIASNLMGKAHPDRISPRDHAELGQLAALAKKALTSPRSRVDTYLSLSRTVATSAITCAQLDVKFVDAVSTSQKSHLTTLGVELIEELAVVENFRKRQEAAAGLDEFQAHERQSESAWKKRESELLQSLAKAESLTSNLRLELDGLAEAAKGEIDKITQAYTDAQADIKQKVGDIDILSGHAAAGVLAGGYDASAAEEKAMANYLRQGALLCMLLIVGLLGWAALGTVAPTFDWERFLSKISLVFLLGVPAAYLARESAKHREQQYHHQQTALDMKAISPFLGSLPAEEQHKLKAAIASRIFGGRDFSKVGSDPYPINTHEILMKIIDKVDFSGKPDKVKKVKPAEGAPPAPVAAPAEAANQ